MDILLATGIYPPEIGGPATYTRSLAMALQKRGHHVRVLAYGEEPSHARDGFPVIFVSRKGGPLVRYLRYAWRAYSLARRSDLIYAQGSVSEGFPSTIASMITGTPFVMKIVGDYAWEMFQQSGGIEPPEAFLQKRHGGVVGWYERIERWTISRARNVIVPSRYLRRVAEIWGVAKEKIFVIQNATDILPEVQSRDVERVSLGVSHRIAILTAVRAVPWKGVDDLVRWWKKLPTSHLLVVAGDGPSLDIWKRLAKAEGLDEDRVRFLGKTDRQTLARWYAAVDAFVLASSYEGYPNVVAEAASSGIPCFVSDQCGNLETRETFPDLVTILPFRDQSAWIKALHSVKQRTGASPQKEITWSFSHMVDATERVLARPEHHVLMIGYERGLLDPVSESYQRVSRLSSEDVRVTSIVLSNFGVDRSHVTPFFRAFSFSGLSFTRMIRAVRFGVLQTRLYHGQTIVTAQDPFAAGLVAYLISRWTNAPLEIQEHADYFSGFWQKESLSHRLQHSLGKFLLRRAERVRVVSERVKKHLLSIGIETTRINVIPVAHQLSSLLERAWTVPKSATVRFLVACRFVPQKGLDTLIDAVSILKVRGVALHLTIIGSGPLETWLRQEIQRRELCEFVSLVSWRPREELWNDADVFLLPSRYEGWARTIVEAMAAGVPIIATNVGCVGSFFRPGIDGIAIPPHDAPALAQAMERMAKDHALQEKFRETARERSRTFALQQELHAAQQQGWKRLLEKRSDVGPRFDFWIVGLMIFAFFVRATSVLLFHNSLLNRELGFFTLVQNWFQGFGYSFVPALGCASAYRSPGFLFFLTALYSIFSPNNTWAQAIVQNAFALAIVWLVYTVGKRLVGKRAAFIGTLLMSIYPYTFYHYTQFYHTFLSSFFLLLLVWFLLRLVETKRLVYALGSGVAIACLAYVQGTILPAMPLIVFWLAWQWWQDWKKTLVAASIMAFVSIGLIVPWTYRNWKTFHRFIPFTTDIGHALFKANNEVIYALTRHGYPQEIVDVETVSSTNPYFKQYRMPPSIEAELRVDGSYRESIAWTEWHPMEPARLDHCPRGNELSEDKFDRYWKGKAFAWIQTHPKEWMQLAVLKGRTFWQPSLFPSVKTGAPWPFAGIPWKVAFARFSVTFASAIVILLGWIGILLKIRKRDRLVWLPTIILFVYTVLHMFIAGYTKYRIPLDNLLAVYAGYATVELGVFFSRRRK